MKKIKWMQWGVAGILVLLAGYSILHVHRAEQKNAIKVERQAKVQKKEDKKVKDLKKEQAKNMRLPIAWDQPSELLPYPDIKQAVHSKKKAEQIWLLVSPEKQRVYVRQGPYTLYTMYASMAQNFDSTKDYQQTPTGEFKLQKQRGAEYFDATRNYGAKYWTSFKGQGLYRFESVPFDQAGQVLMAQAERLGKRPTEKKNIEAYGSIRLSVPDAEWIMKNLPPNTKVFIEEKHPKHDPWELMKD